MKITDYPQVTYVQKDDVFLIDGTQGTKTVPVSRMPYDIFDSIPEMHSQIFRGKNLGSIYTPTQKNAVLTGSFNDLWLGDYWLIGGVQYRIVDFNYFLNTGDTRVSANHVVVVPDQNIGEAAYHSTATTSSYLAATIRNSLASKASSIISAFSDANLLSIEHNLLSTITESKVAAGTMTSSKFELMTLEHIYGSSDYKSRNASQPVNQFSLFRMAPKYIDNNSQYYVQNISDVLYPFHIRPNGTFSSAQNALSVKGIRPFFALR